MLTIRMFEDMKGDKSDIKTAKRDGFKESGAQKKVPPSDNNKLCS
jgi:hypothetical protein